MKNTLIRHISGVKLGAIISLTLAWVLTCTLASYADYQPPGGKPPRGGSGTTGMSI